MNGKVYLVGAGPGNPDLITRGGLRALWSCNAVLYDRLVAPELVDEAPASAQRIFAGKRPGGPHIDQRWINDLLVELASSGMTVVRLKGGDPFVFGRGGEEALCLADHGIEFEVIPGVTSAVAVPAYAGIPVTQRGMAASFAVLTGHECARTSGVRWRELAMGADTLVLMMGVRNLELAASRLIEAGRSADEPAAVIEWGSTAAQRTITGELATIAAVARKEGIVPPATAVVGEVVRLRESIDWFLNAETDLPEGRSGPRPALELARAGGEGSML
jgi:uroporphyrin-III C-methyltransferase